MKVNSILFVAAMFATAVFAQQPPCKGPQGDCKPKQPPCVCCCQQKKAPPPACNCGCQKQNCDAQRCEQEKKCPPPACKCGCKKPDCKEGKPNCNAAQKKPCHKKPILCPECAAKRAAAAPKCVDCGKPVCSRI